MPTPIRYTAPLETLVPDEPGIDAEITETLHKISETTLANGKHAIRSVHAKSHGLLHGTLRVTANLPPQLAQGLFATPADYSVVIRLSTTPGDILDDNVSTPRGMAIKVIGVPGARVAGSETHNTQDFLLVNGPAFAAPNAAGFLKSLKQLEPTTDKAEPLKKIVSKVARGAEAVVETFGGESSTLLSMGGHPTTNILGETFYSQTPFLYGENIAKFGVFPVSPALTALTGTALENTGEPNALRNVVVAYFLENSATWELRVQLCTNTATMPIEDASVIWPVEESPYMPVATFTAPKQDPWTFEKIAALDEGMAFSPWHALAAHRPLGAVNRARKTAYEMSAKFRAENNHREIVEPRTFDDLEA